MSEARRRVEEILAGALSGRDLRYVHYQGGAQYTKWGLVQEDLEDVVSGMESKVQALLKDVADLRFDEEWNQDFRITLTLIVLRARQLTRTEHPELQKGAGLSEICGNLRTGNGITPEMIAAEYGIAPDYPPPRIQADDPGPYTL